jgi:predicted KAP-like P-loop ATPase
MGSLPILSDAAISSADRDLLKFSRYIGPLISILTDSQAETPFTIGIFGSWGSGKTSLLEMLNDYLKTGHPDEFLRVRFNPWVHRSEPNMLVPLLHTLHDTLEEDKKKRFIESAKKIGNVLFRLGSDALLKSMTANVVSLETLEKLEQSYLKERGKVESEIRKLRKTLQTEAEEVANKGAKIIFFIDDLDRCDPAQIIDLLEAIKIFFDLHNVFIILAVDKEVIDRGIEVKYSKFKFGENRQSALGSEYLEKMIQLPLQLYPLGEAQVGSYIEALKPSQGVLARIDLLKTLISPNPRKIKRIINILMVANEISEVTPELKELNVETITRLAILQVQSGDLYTEIVKQPDLLVALELLSNNKIGVDNPDHFSRWGNRAKSIQALCKIYHRPDTYLGTLFKSSSFEETADKLPLYLTMLGG